MKNRTHKTAWIDNEILEQIEQYQYSTKEVEKYSLSDIVNIALFKFFQGKKTESPQLLNMLKGNGGEYKKIQIYVSQKEFDFLEKLAKHTGINSVNKEVKFLLLNIIYKNENLFNNIEMKELSNATNHLNKLGRNLSEVIALLRGREPISFSMNYDGFKRLLTDINTQIKTINDLITDYRAKLKDKF